MKQSTIKAEIHRATGRQTNKKMREKITVYHQRYDFINSLQPSSGTKDKQKQMKIKLYKIRYQKTDRRIRLVMHYEKRIKSTYVINLHRCSQILLPHACSHTHHPTANNN